MATNNTQKTQEKKEDNLIVRGAKWIWANKWGLLGAFAVGVGAGAAGDHVVGNMLSKKGNGPTTPTEL
jgi:hypothetical protein